MNWLDKESLEIIGLGVLVLFVIYPILINAVLGIFSLTEENSQNTENPENLEKE